MPNPFGETLTPGTSDRPTNTVPVTKQKPVKTNHNEWIDTYGQNWTPQTATRDVYGQPFKGQGRSNPSARAKRAAWRAAKSGGGGGSPVTLATPGTATVDLGMATVPVPSTGIDASSVGAPNWWNPTVYTNPNAEQQFANYANALLPSLSPEDQRNIANYLSTNFKDVYGSYANASLPAIPTDLTGLREQFLSPSRVQTALSLLDKVQQTSGGTPGAGYDFLKNALNLMNQYTTNGSPMTREQYDQFVNAVKDMTAAGGNDLKAYSNLAQLFNLPSFTAGSLVSNVPVARLNV